MIPQIFAPIIQRLKGIKNTKTPICLLSFGAPILHKKRWAMFEMIYIHSQIILQ
jgi:hypothetical protein